jgi:hypothetical protein
MKQKKIAAKKFEIDYPSLSESELFSIKVSLEKEFKRRNMKFSTGDIGEMIAITHFNKTSGLSNLQKAPTGTKNVDALCRSGERYSIKTIKDGNKTGTVYSDSIEKKKQLFEHLLIVQINEDYELEALHRFTWKQFLKVRKWDKTMNAWYVAKTQKALSSGEKIYGK